MTLFVRLFWVALFGGAAINALRSDNPNRVENRPKKFYNENGYEIDAEGKLVHRVVSAAVDGPIPKGWVVHHCDGNKLNNDPSNLIQMPWDYHESLHEEMYRKRVLYSKRVLLDRLRREGYYV